MYTNWTMWNAVVFASPTCPVLPQIARRSAIAMPDRKKILIDADDAAFELKDVIVAHLRERGFEVEDLGYMRENDTYYAGVAFNLAKKIQNREAEQGILICGTGLGMAMMANKVEGVFAGTCHDTYSAERLRKSNDANVLTMGARVIGPELAKKVVDAWIDSEFSGGSSAPKVDLMRQLEKEAFGRP